METRAQSQKLSLLKNEKFCDENVSTGTSREQIHTETTIEKIFSRFEKLQNTQSKSPCIFRENHIRYLESSLRSLPSSYECLDSSRPWLIYWTLHAAYLLNFNMTDELLQGTVSFLLKCRDPGGGFGGGPGQIAHLATTFGAVNALSIIGNQLAYDTIGKDLLLKFLNNVREPNGAFRLHIGGEIDVRGAYCAISCTKLLNFSPEKETLLFKNTADWIARCQTYEGGFGGAPGLEAHAGYTYCALASLVMLGKENMCNINALLRWSISRQMRFEGGFQGRTNKLVDSCYSFWVAGTIKIAQAILQKQDPLYKQQMPIFFDGEALERYIILCCQRQEGGLVDKPMKRPDLYHTCYSLSGLSIAQHCQSNLQSTIKENIENELLPTHPLHNISPKAVLKCLTYFRTDISKSMSEENIL